MLPCCPRGTLLFLLAGLLAGASLPAAGADKCDPRYKDSEKCVPVAKDVDCAGGGGDGPRYVQAPFRYEGSDPYGLDRNKDGIACEPPKDYSIKDYSFGPLRSRGWSWMSLFLSLGVMVSGKSVDYPREADMRDRLCADMDREVTLPNKGKERSHVRVDCLSPDYDIEVDRTEKWYEAMAQAFYYSYLTGREPGIILVWLQVDRSLPRACASLRRIPISIETSSHDLEMPAYGSQS